MDLVIILIDQNDPELARAAEQQADAMRTAAGVKSVTPIPVTQTVADMIHRVSRRFTVGSSQRLAKLHLVGHGRVATAADTYIEFGCCHLRAGQTTHFRELRRCFINTGTVAPGACIELNVCSAGGNALAPIAHGLAQDAGVPVKACPQPIEFYPTPRLFNPEAGFRTIFPDSRHAISEEDYVDVEDFEAFRRAQTPGYFELRPERTHREL